MCYQNKIPLKDLFKDTYDKMRTRTNMFHKSLLIILNTTIYH